MIKTEATKTPFQKIFDGEWDSYTLYRDEVLGVMAFLDIKPFTFGQTIVIPREPVDHIDDLEPGRYAVLAGFTRIVSRHLKSRLNPAPLRITEQVYGYQIPHAHRILAPSYERGDVSTAIGNDTRLELSEATLRSYRAKLWIPEVVMERHREHLQYLGGMATELPQMH